MEQAACRCPRDLRTQRIHGFASEDDAISAHRISGTNQGARVPRLRSLHWDGKKLWLAVEDLARGPQHRFTQCKQTAGGLGVRQGICCPIGNWLYVVVQV